MSYNGGGRDPRAYDGQVSQRYTDEQSIKTTLSQMQQEALTRTNGNLVEAEAQLVGILGRDRRFDRFDHEKLASHIQDVWAGRRLDLDNPVLRGGPERPGQLRTPRTG
jgi:hypothetical protein